MKRLQLVHVEKSFYTLQGALFSRMENLKRNFNFEVSKASKLGYLYTKLIVTVLDGIPN